MNARKIEAMCDMLKDVVIAGDHFYEAVKTMVYRFFDEVEA